MQDWIPSERSLLTLETANKLVEEADLQQQIKKQVKPLTINFDHIPSSIRPRYSRPGATATSNETMKIKSVSSPFFKP